MTTFQEILDFVQDNDVKFVRLAFCDIFGTQKNIAVFADELPQVFEQGICIDGSSVPGFMNVEESDLVLWPDPATVSILPWRPAEGRVIRMFCDIRRPNGREFEGNCRGFLKSMVERLSRRGLTCNIGTECEFYLFQLDDQGNPTRIPMDRGGYFDIAPLDKGENIRREICFALSDMGLHPQHSHHESGFGQNEVDFRYAPALEAADNLITFKSVVKSIAQRNGLYASFMPKPLPTQAGSGLHINLSLQDSSGENLFAREITPDSPAGHFMAGVMKHARELTCFFNPTPNSYARFGSYEAPQYVSWSRQNRSPMIRIPSATGSQCRMELRSPDPTCNPYLAIGLMLAAGLEGMDQKLPLPQPVNRNLFLKSQAQGIEQLPGSLPEAIALANQSDLVARELPDLMAAKYFQRLSQECLELRQAADPQALERERYFEVL